MKPRVSIIYRTFIGENAVSRPSWYSKELCLKSILASYNILKKETPVSFSLLLDGYLKPHDKWSETLKKIVEPIGIILESPHRGNAEITISSIYKALDEPEESVVVIAEDDYLWLAQALTELYHALTELPVHYATPYDHPVRYQPDYPKGADYPHWHNIIYITAERHWRTQESTCMTFATTCRTLKEDIVYFEKYKDNEKGKPEDRELFREMQGLGGYLYKDPYCPRILVGPIPSLATHVHLPWLAPLVNWDEEAKKIVD